MAVTGGTLTPEADTRLRFVRRLAVAMVLLVGVASALSQFASLDRIAGGLLASSAIAAAVIGFAARQTLANGVAGVMLAIAQPVRLGDMVTFEGETGLVEDVRLTYTYLRAADGHRVVIPNERLASGVLINETIGDPTVRVEISVWIASDADHDRALALLSGTRGATARIAEITAGGVRLAVAGEVAAAPLRPAREAELRAHCLRLLREAGLLPQAGGRGI